MIQAIDYKTGKVRWSHKWDGPARSGLLSTAGNLLFGAGPGNALVALNATTGDALWHTRLNAAISNGPITYELDGLQYVIVGANDTLDGKYDRKRRALPENALGEHMTAQSINELAGNAQAKSGTPKLARPRLIHLPEILPDRIEI